MYKRIFAFGCSMTNYHWPTWANVIAVHLNLPLYNYAIQGCGNVSIMHRMVEADIIHTFKDDDLILVLWSGWNREDRFRDNHWISGGPVLNKGNKSYCSYFREKYWTLENDIVKNATAIISSNKMFKISWQGHMLDYHKTSLFGDILYESKFKDLYNQIPRKNFFDYTVNRMWDQEINDLHPDILTHAHNASIILKKLDLEDIDIKSYENQLEKAIEYIKNNKTDNDYKNLMMLERYFDHKCFVHPPYSRIKIK